MFDEATRRAGPLNGLLGTPNDYAWSPDNSAEIDRGWIVSGAGPAELAGPMGVDPGVLTSTLEQYNASARAGRDETATVRDQDETEQSSQAAPELGSLRS